MPGPMTSENAEILALEALGWLAGEEDGLEKFLSQSGIEADALPSFYRIRLQEQNKKIL